MDALSFVKFQAARAWAWCRARPALSAVLLLALVYALYLPRSGYAGFPDETDAHYYWYFARQYGRTGAFRFLSFATGMRGYLFPLVIAPLAIGGPHIGCEPITLMRPVGTLLAATFFGAVGPGLWQAVRGPLAAEVSLVRRLVFGAIGFALWRDYFNFPLTDFPALFALLVALWALLGSRTVWSGALVGLALGAAINTRPVFIAALPFVGLLACWPQRGQPEDSRGGFRRLFWARRLAMIAALALVLAPQYYLNAKNFNTPTPLVLAREPWTPTNLFLQQLEWGLLYQKYETTLKRDYPIEQVRFLDARGSALFATTHLQHFSNQGQYLALAAQHPFGVLGVWLRHLFNGLDLQYATPYIKAIYVSTWLLAWVNYTVLLGGAAVLMRLARRGPVRLRVVVLLAALLAPCVGALPVAVECRFLLPLHMLLSAAVAFGANPVQAWRAATRGRRTVWAVGYVGLVAAAFSLSANAQLTLQKGPRVLFGRAHVLPSPPAERHPGH